jgi:enamine deaminase RidA (YjgF/YER057c/UK114 family)
MATNTTTAEERLAKLGVHLPDAPTPFGAYVPAVQTGNLLFLSGILATSGPYGHVSWDCGHGP